jgi:uncharacterized protein
MNRLALLLVLALPFSAVSAHADDASHRAKAEEMMTLLHAEKLVDQISANLKKQVADAANKVIGASPTPEQKSQALDLENKAFKMIDDQIGWKVMEPGFADVYAKNFTDTELDAIITFYKSPAGEALLTKMPQVNSQVGEFGSSKMATLEPQLKQLFQDFQKSQAATPHPPAATTPAPSAAPAPPTTTPSAPK